MIQYPYMHTPVRAVIFDLDGTLLNTLEDLTDSCNAALRQVGAPERTREEVRTFVGNGLGVLMQKALPNGTQNARYEEALLALKNHYAHNWQNKTKPYEGVQDVLQTLFEKNIRLGIVSNKPDAQVKELAQLYFADFVPTECAVGEHTGVRRKPAPDSVLKVLTVFGVPKEQCIYVGDSEVDIQTAANASLACISVTWGFREEAYLAEHGATQFARTASDLKNELLSRM